MAHIETRSTSAIPTGSTEVVGWAAPAPTNIQDRDQRILELRDAIHVGDYHVTAADLADALIRNACRTN